MRKLLIRSISALQAILIAVSVFSVTTLSTVAAENQGIWVKGDFHTHTNLSDGSYKASEVAAKASEYGLDWYSATDHGGAFSRNDSGAFFTSASTGAFAVMKDGAQLTNSDGSLRFDMYRWNSILNEGTDKILANRAANKKLLQFNGFEWNVPTHEHASVGIIGNDNEVKVALSNFEYMFDQSDVDTSRDSELYPKNNTKHDGAIAAATWLEQNYPTASYFLPNHPSRKLAFKVSDFREFNDAAPNVCFGFEALPGHQKSSFRGGLGYFTYKDDTTGKMVTKSKLSDVPEDKRADSIANYVPYQRTYGGADYMLAKVGGLWDAMLGEGRNFWIFANSDYHSNNSTEPDFWPGEYSKNITFVKDKTYQGILDGMRSGNNVVVLGDLINELDYSITNNGQNAVMGGRLTPVKDKDTVVTIKFKSPSKNNANTDGRTGLDDKPEVDHIDLIAGEVGDIIPQWDETKLPGKDENGNVTNETTAETLNPAYTSAVNETTKVIKTFTKSDWKIDSNGYNVITFTLPKTEKKMYYRLRGTNLAPNTQGQTDEFGNPLIDTPANAEIGTNTAEKAFSDLWFYSNPIYVNAPQVLAVQNNNPATADFGMISLMVCILSTLGIIALAILRTEFKYKERN